MLLLPSLLDLGDTYLGTWFSLTLLRLWEGTSQVCQGPTLAPRASLERRGLVGRLLFHDHLHDGSSYLMLGDDADEQVVRSMWTKPQSNRARYFGLNFFRFGFVFVMLQVHFGI